MNWMLAFTALATGVLVFTTLGVMAGNKVKSVYHERTDKHENKAF